MPTPSRRVVETVCELASDPGWIGQLLRRIPEEIRREADAQPDPWAFLLGKSEGTDRDLTKTLKAAESQRWAAFHLGHAAIDVGSVSGDSFRSSLQQLVEGGASDKEFARLIARNLRLHWRYDGGKRLLEGVAPEWRAEILKWQSRFMDRDARIFGRKRAEAWWSIRLVTEFKADDVCDLAGAKLVSCWLRRDECGNPGFAFLHDEVILKILKTQEGLRALTPSYLKRVRKDYLGLSKAPLFVTGVRIEDGVWAFTNRRGKVVGRTSINVGVLRQR